MIKAIPTSVINLEKSKDRQKHILRQFENNPAFDVTTVPAFESSNEGRGLWHNTTSKTGKHRMLLFYNFTFFKPIINKLHIKFIL